MDSGVGSSSSGPNGTSAGDEVSNTDGTSVQSNNGLDIVIGIDDLDQRRLLSIIRGIGNPELVTLLDVVYNRRSEENSPVTKLSQTGVGGDGTSTGVFLQTLIQRGNLLDVFSGHNVELGGVITQGCIGSNNVEVLVVSDEHALDQTSSLSGSEVRQHMGFLHIRARSDP